MAFHAPVETRKRLDFDERAEKVVAVNFDKVFGRELVKAVASAK
ncbi:hypothetical protein [Paraburkholderia sp. HP33-1]|nr:hypothetical protein [Paraburkholderia sp. HP33-1]